MLQATTIQFWHRFAIGPSRHWMSLGLTARFALAALMIMGSGMALFGAWVTNRIEQGVVRNTATGAGLLVEPLLRDDLSALGTSAALDEASIARLRNRLAASGLALMAEEIQIWTSDGRLLFGMEPAADGAPRPPAAFNLARAGEVQGRYRPRTSSATADGGPAQRPYLEILTPIKAPDGKRVVAVAEFRGAATMLSAELRRARMQSWVVMIAVGLTMLSCLLAIVRHGSRRIEEQEASLKLRIGELSRLLKQNESLRRRIDELHHRSVERNEMYLRRVGAELHDGPAQMIGLALLRIDALAPQARGPEAKDQPNAGDDLEIIRGALRESLTEIRNISAGLALPAIDRLSAAETLRLAASAHERRTGTLVALDLEQLPAELPHDLKTCLYRFVQEGLNNAFRHAEGTGQFVRVGHADDILELRVGDAGPGFSAGDGFGKGLGLVGLRDRIDALGGTFEIISVAGRGTELVARFKLPPTHTD
jgi:signal transduction histidine kinase